MSNSGVVAKVIEQVTTYFSLCEWAVDHKTDWDIPERQLRWVNVPLTHFNGADPAFSYTEELRGLLPSHQRIFIVPEEIAPSDLASWDSAGIFMTSGDWDDVKNSLYFVMRVRRVPLKEVRGLFPLTTGVVVEYSHATLGRGGDHKSCRYYAEWRGGDKWVLIGQPRWVEDTSMPEEDRKNIELSKSLSFTDFYEWKVDIGYLGFPTLGLTTDPKGIREIFRLRDLPNGSSRRAALRHWVSSYYRMPPDADSDAEAIRVLEHLRGTTEFRWNGMECRIRPSQYDIARLGRNKPGRKVVKA